MMRVVVASLTGIFSTLYLFYFYIPLLYNEHITFNSLVNVTDPTIVQSYNIGQGFYLVTPLVPILIASFLVISYALKTEGG